MVSMVLVMLLPFVAAVQRGRLEIRQVREGGGLDHSPETFAEYVPVPDVDESWQVKLMFWISLPTSLESLIEHAM